MILLKAVLIRSVIRFTTKQFCEELPILLFGNLGVCTPILCFNEKY